MYEDSHMKIIKAICKYYGKEDENELVDLLRSRENKCLFLLILKNNNYFNDYNIMNILRMDSKRSIKNNIRKAEEKFLINTYFRKKYLEIECEIKKELNYI